MASPQLTRQWTVLRELTASRRGSTLKQLAREADVHERTVRRDIYALMDAGFPIEKVDGEEPVRFRFHPDHKLPELPLEFTEALALYHATTSSPLFENPLYHLRLEKALYKIQEAFPAEVKGYIGSFRQAYSHRQPIPRDHDLADICNVLQKQITFSYRIHFAYTNLKGVASERSVDPYFIHIHEGEFYLLGYCHLRHDYRIFRIDCIRDLQALEEEQEKAEISEAVTVTLGKAYDYATQVAKIMQTPFLTEEGTQVNPAFQNLLRTVSAPMEQAGNDLVASIRGVLPDLAPVSREDAGEKRHLKSIEKIMGATIDPLELVKNALKQTDKES